MMTLNGSRFQGLSVIKRMSVCGCMVSMAFLASQTRADSSSTNSRPVEMASSNVPATLVVAAEHQPEKWNIHGQATVIDQAHPPFSSPYSGDRSMSGAFQQRETLTAATALALRLWPGAELDLDVFMNQGYGLSRTYGVAGFSDDDANRAGSDYPRESFAPCLKQTIGLGGDQEWISSGGNQLAGYQDVSRLTLMAGGFALPAYFDNNAYAHDPESDFANAALCDAGAWDYAANARGDTLGVMVELNQKAWAVRYAMVEMPETLSGMQTRWDGAQSLQHDVEIEWRYTLGGLSGKTRLLGFYERGWMGNYRDALRLAAGGANINNAMQASRTAGHEKYGGALNEEQALSDVLGMFVRVSWNNGRTEDWGNTDIDESLATGLSLKGSWWGRKNDTIGLGCAWNGVSKEHRAFLAAGGNTIGLGDGQLPCAGFEKCGELYYAFKITRALTITPDYQCIENPGYNRNRGPVNVLGLRVHAEF